jgi:hypothetical protein
LRSFTSIAAMVAVLALGTLPAYAAGPTWTKLKNTPPGFGGPALLLMDGTVIVQNDNDDGNTTGDWYRLTPDNTGSYVNGTWSQIASMPNGYTPTFFASQVLPTGNVVVNGGEYNGGSGVWTNKGAYYNFKKNKWTALKPPAGWSTIGDAQSVVLGDGTYMLADCCNTNEVTFNAKTKAWTKTGTGKADDDDEEGWTLLPSGQVLTVDCWKTESSEILTNGTWASAGSTGVNLPDPSSKEMGPQVLRPNGTVFAVGATGNTAIYTIATGKWAVGPQFPKSGSSFYDEADGPGALEPNGNVLLAASPGVFKSPVQFFEFDGTNLNTVVNTPNAANISSFLAHLLVLPTGQILQTDFTNDIEVYTPTGGPQTGWAPTISSFPTTVKHGKSYTLTGVQLAGLSSGGAYGDDYQDATNFPVVRITNTATGHVFYTTTINLSSFLPQNPNPVTATVEIPKTIETGASTLEVVANGIPSAPFALTVK